MRISDWSSDVCSSDLLIFESSRSGFWVCCAAQREQTPSPRILWRWIKGVGSACSSPQPCPAHPAPATHAVCQRSAPPPAGHRDTPADCRSEEHTSELQSLMRISYAVFCLKKKKTIH